jgi:DNA-binding beta-propeller fold protein YncE
VSARCCLGWRAVRVGGLLPNGWTLTPEGAQIPVSDLHVANANSNTVSVSDTAQMKEIGRS